MAFKVTIGQYINVDSVVHRMDPRVKIVLSILFMILVFVADSLVLNLLLAVSLIGIILISRVSVSTVLRAIRPIIFFMLFTALLNLFFVKGGNTLIAAGPLSITEDGLFSSIHLTARFFFLMVAGTMLALTTSPIALTDGIESLASPLDRFGLPTHEIAMMLSIALRFIPTLATEAERIIKAQQARGVSFDEGSLIKRARLFVPIVVPLFASSIRHAENLAVAMDARCYQGKEGRTHYRVLELGVYDYGAIVCFAALVIICATLRFLALG